MDIYESAKVQYLNMGVDTDAALDTLSAIPISIHCWQGDDVRGFDTKGVALSGGIQATGNYPGKARTPEELMSDINMALSLIAGKHKLNLHASYAIFKDGEWADRDKLRPEHFEPWVNFARKRGLGLDFNPTLFSHPKAEGLTLSSPDGEIRAFWIEHCHACLKISEYFADELGQPCLMNIWAPDGLKDAPADRLGPRARFKDSLDCILSAPYDRSKVFVSLESKVFGIGLESYTAGSAEFCAGYAREAGILPLMDTGHYHPTETVSDKISSALLFNERAALHISRPVRWDSDHVVRYDDETRELAKEIVSCGAVGRVFMGLDYFDASINRVAAWVAGVRAWQKALLSALLTPHDRFRTLQDEGRFTELLVLQEELKTYPLGAVWDEFCRRGGVPRREMWYGDVQKYERDVLMLRDNGA